MEEWKAHVVSSPTEKNKKKKKRSSHRSTNLTILCLSITVRVPLTRKIKHLSYDTIVADHKEMQPGSSAGTEERTKKKRKDDSWPR